MLAASRVELVGNTRSAMEAMAWIVGSAGVVVVTAWWAGRRWHRVDNFYEQADFDRQGSEAGARPVEQNR